MNKKAEQAASKARAEGHKLGDDLARRGDPLAATLIHQEVEKDYRARVPEYPVIKVLERAIAELERLRADNRLMRAQLHVMEIFDSAINGARNRNMEGMASEDVVYSMRQHVEYLKTDAREKQQAAK